VVTRKLHMVQCRWWRWGWIYRTEPVTFTMCQFCFYFDTE